jgi:3-methylfumaryl-CoA hydratase
MSEHIDPAIFSHWIGRRSEAEDLVTERLVASFRAILEPHLVETPDNVGPPGLHWCLAPPIARMAELGGDGHPKKGRQIPAVPQPRRMWAGGTIETFDEIRLGDRVRRITTIADVTCKQGRSGELWFIILNHDYVTPRGLAVRERQDLVYREPARPGERGAQHHHAEPPPRRERTLVWTVETSSVLLFRYSAITFNGHRIHYDLPYATEVEGYSGLVVHGPLQATILLNLATFRQGSTPRHFSFRGIAPAIAGTRLAACTGTADFTDRYWTEGPDGRIHMEAQAISETGNGAAKPE